MLCGWAHSCSSFTPFVQRWPGASGSSDILKAMNGTTATFLMASPRRQTSIRPRLPITFDQELLRHSFGRSQTALLIVSEWAGKQIAWIELERRTSCPCTCWQQPRTGRDPHCSVRNDSPPGVTHGSCCSCPHVTLRKCQPSPQPAERPRPLVPASSSRGHFQEPLRESSGMTAYRGDEEQNRHAFVGKRTVGRTRVSASQVCCAACGIIANRICSPLPCGLCNVRGGSEQHFAAFSILCGVSGILTSFRARTIRRRP
jgi:hypothetical protein